MKLYIKTVLTEWKSASHDKRELALAKELEYETLVYATTKYSNKIIKETIDGFNVIRIPSRKYGSKGVMKYVSRVWCIFRMIYEVKKKNAAVISGHNFDGWIVGYLASLFKKTKLVYDSHEFELYQDGSGKLRRVFIKTIEKFIFKNTNLAYVVTQSIANDLKKIYNLKRDILVVRNIPEKIDFDYHNVKKNRREFLNNLNIDDSGFILMYHGGFTHGRGIEQAIEAVSKLENVGLVLMGFALDDNYINMIRNKINILSCADRVYIKDAVGIPALYENVAAADLGVVLSVNSCLNHYYSLPNKLFENIQAGTPVIASNFPEISKIIKKYNNGVLIEPEDVNSFIDRVKELQYNKQIYNKFKEGASNARNELCWQNEKQRLKSAIQSLESIEKGY